VSVASVAHESSKGIDFEDINWVTRKRSEIGTYQDSKLANVQYMFGLGERLKARGIDGDVTVTSLQPGFAASDLYRKSPWIVRTMLLPLIGTHARNLSINEVRSAVDESFANGTYTNPSRLKLYGPPVVGQPSAVAKDLALVEQLWLKTEEIVGEKFFA